jgi:hypothetical protein
MRLRPGDRLRCSNSQCRLEVMVMEMKGAEERPELPRCWCGSPMRKPYASPEAAKLHLRPSAKHKGAPRTSPR